MKFPPIESVSTQPAVRRTPARYREVRVELAKGQAPRACLEPQELFLVQEFPDTVKERVAHRVVAAAHLGMHLGVGDEQLPRYPIRFRDVLAVDADKGADVRLRVRRVLVVPFRLAADPVTMQLALVGVRRFALDEQVYVQNVRLLPIKGGEDLTNVL